jgi:CHC2 zinc finger
LRPTGIQLRRIGDELVGLCPACRDDVDRFGANLKKNVFNCRKCNAAGDAIALEQLLSGSSFQEAVEALAGKPPPQKKSNERNGSNGKKYRRATLTYDYRDPGTGDIRYRKKRFENPDGTKTFSIEPKNRGGSPPSLYGSEHVADPREGHPVFVVEGEKKVERLRELGAIAVSGDTGAKSKWLPSHAELLRGLDVMLWPDSDEPGEEYIANAARCLKDAAASIRVVRPFGKPNGAKGRDVCDWQDGPEELVALIDDAKPYAAPAGSASKGHDVAATIEFERGENGQILKGHPGNIALAVKLLGVTLRHNDFSFQTEVFGLPGFGPILNDAAAGHLRIKIHEAFDFLPSHEVYDQVLTNEAHKGRFHPIRDYLRGLT